MTTKSELSKPRPILPPIFGFRSGTEEESFKSIGGGGRFHKGMFLVKDLLNRGIMLYSGNLGALFNVQKQKPIS